MSYLSSIKLPNNEIYDLKDSRINFGTTDDKFLNHDGTWTSITPEIEDVFGNDEDTNEIVSFDDGAEGIPLTDVSVDIEPVQDGTPWVAPSVNTEPYLLRQSPDLNHGYNSEVDTLIGGTIAWNQLVQNGNFADTSNWYANSGGSLSVSGNVGTVTLAAQSTSGIYQVITSISSHKYILCGEIKSTIDIQFGSTQIGGRKNLSARNSYQKYAYVLNCETSSNSAALVVYTKNASSTGTADVKNVMLIDLTATFGTEIADYVYGLEQTTAGSGIAWLKSYGFLTKDYYAYNDGSLVSVKTSEHRTTGFNQWDEEWELGIINQNTGQNEASSVQIRTKNYMPVIDTNYYLTVTSEQGSNTNISARFYDADKNYIGSLNAAGERTFYNSVFRPPANARYMRWNMQASYGTTYNHDICINISKTTGTPKNGDYVAYKSHSYSLGNDDLRGIFKLSNGNLYADGDVKTSDGKIQRKYDIVDLGTLNWEAISDNRFVTHNLTTKELGYKNLLCTSYPAVNSTEMTNGDKCIRGSEANIDVLIKDTSYSDAQTFKTAMSGVYLVYELATPTTETADSFASPQIVDPNGTEEYVDERSVSVPVGHKTVYQNLAPIYGWNQVKVHRSGFNQWDEEWEVGTLNWNTGQPSSADNFIRAKNYIPVLPSTTYYVTSPTIGVVLYEYDENHTAILPSSGDPPILNTATGGAFTTSSNARYVRFRCRKSGTTTYNNDVCINISKTTGTPKNGDYVSFRGNDTYIVDLGGTRYSGTLDVTTGELIITYGMVDENVNWTYSYRANGQNYVTYLDSSIKTDGDASTNLLPVNNRGAWKETTPVAQVFYESGEHGMRVYGYFESLAEFKLTYKGLQFLYELATPLTIQLTPTQIEMLEGTNNIWTNLGNVTVKWTSNTAPYLDTLKTCMDYATQRAIKNIGMIEVTKTGVSSLPITITDSNIRANDKVINSTFSNPSVKITNWNVTTIDGSLTISGTIDGTTDITLDLVPKVN